MKKLTLIFYIALNLLSCSQISNNRKSENSEEVDKNNSSFEFDGNYLPTKEFKINNHLLNSIEIGTNDSLEGNKIALIFIRFTNLKTEEYYVIRKTTFEGTKDKFSIIANDPLLGKIQISGSFIGKNGPLNDNIEDPNTIVFKGTILADGINNEKLECTYFEGD
jgi:hypothetical protein